MINSDQVVIQNGHVILTEKKGLGVELNEASCQPNWRRANHSGGDWTHLHKLNQ